MKLHIAMLGLIGAGKSTLAAALGQRLDLPVYPEPVAENPYLEDFYADMGAHAFAMQIYLLQVRFRQQQEIIWRGQGGVQDRSIYEDTIFARMLQRAGHMSARDHETYARLFDVTVDYMRRPDVLVYVYVTPEQALANIRTRGRPCESGITIEYLESLYAAYEEFVRDISRTTPVIRVDNSTFPSVDDVAAAVAAGYGAASNIYRAPTQTTQPNT